MKFLKSPPNGYKVFRFFIFLNYFFTLGTYGGNTIKVKSLFTHKSTIELINVIDNKGHLKKGFDTESINLQPCEDGTAAKPFKDLGKTRNISSAGIYYFDLNGTTFSTYVDANGYIQVAIDFGNGSGNLPQETSLTNTSRGVLTPTILASLTDTNEIRVSHSGGVLDATSISSVLINKLLSNTTLHTGVNDVEANSSWIGTGASFLTSTGSTGTSTAGSELQENIFHTRGDGSGIHWIPSGNFQRTSFSNGEIPVSESFHLWVRAIRTIDSDCDGINDDVDLDDDNDGVLDIDEGFCQSLDLDLINDVNGVELSVFALSSDTDYTQMQTPPGDPSPLAPETFINGYDELPGRGIFKYTYSNPPQIYIDESGMLNFTFYQYINIAGSTTAYTTRDRNIVIETDQGELSGIWNISIADRAILNAGGWVKREFQFPVLPNTPLKVSKLSIDMEGISGGGGATFNPTTSEVYALAIMPYTGCSEDLDTDGDMISNHLDLDSDGDGCPDTVEAGIDLTNTDLQTADIENGNGTANTTTSTANALLNPNGTDANNDGLNDSVDAGQDGVTDYNSTYNAYALNENVNFCDDFDGDEIPDIVDIDDDNDGIPDEIELGCSRTTAFKTSQTNTANAQQVVGEFTLGNSIADFTLDFVDVNGATANTSFTFFDGVQYLINDNDNDGFFQENIHITARTGAIINKLIYGPEVTINTIGSAGKDINSQEVTLFWDSGATATVFDPDNQLDVPDGTILSSGRSISQVDFENNGTATWFVEFDAAFSSELNISIQHQSQFSMGFESFGFAVELCSDRDSDLDGSLNHLDLDSDGDDCPDAKEAGVGGILEPGDLVNVDGTVNTADAIAKGPYGTNGLADALENPVDSGALNYQNTYSLALSKNASICLDSDGDGIVDQTDLDDDNDGILDINECDENSRNFVEFSGAAIAKAIGINLFSTDITGNDQDGNSVTITFSIVSDPEVGAANTTVNGIQFAGNSRNLAGLKVTSSVPMYAVQFENFSDVEDDEAILPGCNSVVRDERDVWAIDQEGVYTFKEGHIAVPNSFLEDVLPVLTNRFRRLGVTQLVLPDPETLVCGSNQNNPTAFQEKSILNFNTPTQTFRMYGTSASHSSPTTGGTIDPIGNYRFYLDPEGCTDTDGDGIPNNLDLDSDGDGCPDAVEGAGSFTAGNLVTVTNLAGGSTNVQQNLGSSSNDDGTPNIEGTITTDSETQGAGAAHTFGTNTECCTDAGNYAAILDTDGDNIGDDCDLDDDNDGILDVDENCVATSEAIHNGTTPFDSDETSTGTTVTVSTQQTNANVSINGNYNPPQSFVINGQQRVEYTSAVQINPDNASNETIITYTFSNPILASDVGIMIEDIDRGTPTGLISVSGGTATTADFSVQSILRNGESGESPEINYNSTTGGIDFPSAPSSANRYASLISGHSSNTLTELILTISNLGNGGSKGDNVRIYLVPIGNNCDNDLDSDGIPNNLDLDSDGDGCPDAVEGAGSFTAGNLVTVTNLAGGSTNIQQNLGSSSNDDGTPNIEGTVTTDSETQGAGAAHTFGTNTECCTDAGNYDAILDTDGDNIGDDCDLDDDNDGILDVDEGLIYSSHLTNSNTYCDENLEVPSSVTQNFTSINTNNDQQNEGATQTYHFDLPISRLSFGVASLQEINAYYGNFTIIYEDNTMVSNVDFTVKTSAEYTDEENTWIRSFGLGDRSENISKLVLGTGEIALEGLGRPGAQSAGIVTFNIDNTKPIKSFSVVNLSSNAASSGPTSIFEIFGTPICDFDNDGIPDSLDLDSDNDGCPDVIEAAVPTALQSSDISASDGITDNTSEAVINVAIDSVGTNGFAASLEDLDTNAASILNAHTTTNYTTYALDSTKNGCGVPMITEVYWKGSEKIVEVVNIDSTKVIVPNGANINLFNNGVTTSRTANWTNSAEISGRASMLFANSSSVSAQTKSGVSITENATVIAFDSISDVIAISRNGKANTPLAWEARIDVAQNMKENTAYVRIDEALSPNTTYTDSEWVAFVDDNLDPYRDLAGGGPERHPHDPLISEITSGVNVEANALLGLHRFTPTTRTGTAWDNGYPDRSRHVKISENYAHSGSTLKARKLTVNTNSKLAITDNLLVVTDAISLVNANDEVRLVGTSQLVQTHTGANGVTGLGKLLVDQNSTVPSIYRYNYLSSPANTIGANTYTIETILKDGTLPVDANTEIFVATDNTKNLSTNIARGIHFIDGYDGKFETDSTFIADAWIYTYASASGGRSNWVQKKKNGVIPATDGFIMKGPGRAQNYTFMGSAKDGELKTSVGANESYLVGNPFSSAISAKKFIEDNINSTTGTLYFWQHAGEDDTSTDTSGHNYSGYIGGYATRNISMGLAANDPSALVGFDINIEAEEAFIQGNIDVDGNVSSLKLSNTGDFVDFKEIIRGVDTLKIRYKSDLDKEITLKINGQDSGDHTLPSSTEFTTFDIVLCVERGADVGIFSNDSNTAYIDFLQLKDADGKNSCEPSIEESNDFIAPEPYIPIGQGFFIQGSDNGGEVVFDNSQREFKTEGSESVFFRSSKKPATSLRSSSNKLPIIKLGMDYLDAQGMSIHRKIGISFNQYNSFEYEKGYDSEIYDLGVTDIYWKFPNSESTYVIAGVQEISDNLEVPFDIVMDYTGSVAIQIDEMEAIDREVFIKDHKTDRTYLLNDKTISLQLEKGIHTERFSLVFKGNAVLSVDDTKNVTDKDIAIYMDSNSKELVVQNHGNLLISKVELFNLLGQKIAGKAILENTLENRLKVKKLSTNVYIVNVKTDKGVVSKKVVIE